MSRTFLFSLSRGGSDLTTTTIGKALGLREIQILITMIVLTCVYMYIDALRFVICFSQFEEKFEEINGDEASPSIPLTSGFDGNSAAQMVTEESRNDTEMQGQEDHRLCSDINASQDFVSGIMKIVPEVDSDADYWLLPDDDVLSLQTCGQSISYTLELISTQLLMGGYAEVSHEVKLKAGLFDVGLEDIKRARLQKCSSSLSAYPGGLWLEVFFCSFCCMLLLYALLPATALSIPYCCGLMLFAMLHGCILLHVDPETALYTKLWRACAGPLVTVPREGERMFYFPQGHIEQDMICVRLRVVQIHIQTGPQDTETVALVEKSPLGLSKMISLGQHKINIFSFERSRNWSDIIWIVIALLLLVSSMQL
ncbi:hypothetical protein ACSBR2_036343 [Camellia fascicularis]